MIKQYEEGVIIFRIVNLGYPRKIVINKVNNIIFEAKLKDIRLSDYKVISYTIGIIFFSQQIAYAYPSVVKSNKAIEFLDNYGPPLILTAVDLLKLGAPIKIHMKNLWISHN